MELRKVNEDMFVLKINDVGSICETVGHPTNECPTILAFKEVLHNQANAININKKPFHSPYSETYNSGWRNHPNFNWRNDNVALPPQSHSNYVPYNLHPKKSLKDTLQQFMESQATINNQTS